MKVVKSGEKVGESLGTTGGIVDGKPRTPIAVEIVGAKNGKTHGDAMVVIGVNGNGAGSAEAAHLSRIGINGDVTVGGIGAKALGRRMGALPEFVELRGEGSKAVRFLAARMGKVAKRQRTVEKGSEGGKREKGVGNGVEIIIAPTGATGSGGGHPTSGRGAKRKPGLLKDRGKGSVALKTVPGGKPVENKGDGSRNGQREEIAGRGGVGLNGISGWQRSRAGIGERVGDGRARNAGNRTQEPRRNRLPKLRHHAESHLDKRLGNSGTGEMDGKRGIAGIRGNVKKRAQKLRTGGGIHAEGATGKSARAQDKGEMMRGSTGAGNGGNGTLGTKGGKKPAHGPDTHGRIAIKRVNTTRMEGKQGGEKTGRCAGIANMQRGLGTGDVPPCPVDGEGAGCLVGMDLIAEGAQGIHHDARVTTEKGVREHRPASAKHGKNEGAIGNALGAGKRNGGANGTGKRTDREKIGKWLG